MKPATPTSRKTAPTAAAARRTQRACMRATNLARWLSPPDDSGRNGSAPFRRSLRSSMTILSLGSTAVPHSARSKHACAAVRCVGGLFLQRRDRADRVVTTPTVPDLPFRPAVRAGDWLAVSGQVGILGEALVAGGAEAQT